MPNWCQNEMTVESPEHSYLELFTSRARGEQGQPVSLAALVPEPGDPSDSNYDWYSWRLNHWGCKWDLNFDGPGIAVGAESAKPSSFSDTPHSEGTGQPGVIKYNFITPYGPPVEAFIAVSRKFPDLKFTIRYGEAGMEIAGQTEIQDGQVISDQELEISEVLTPEQMWF